jgi:Peptidase family M28
VQSTSKPILEERSAFCRLLRSHARSASIARRTVAASLMVAIVATVPLPASPVSQLVQTVGKGVDVDRAMETMRRVYDTDHFFTFPKFEETAAYLKQRLEESGVTQVEIGGAVADGKTQAGYWTEPLAWDVKEARLEVVEPERTLLCDYQSVPTSLGMWSGSTPKEGVTTELVDITRTPWSDVKGKLVLTDRNSAGYKHQLVKNGALGAVNGFTENPDLQDGRQWVNAWGDDGWGFTKTSTPLLSFSVTPRQVAHLRQLLASGKRVMVHAVADTSFYSGRYPWVTGVLPGSNPEEEVLVLGHTSEQGANDNATGVSAMIEALHTIATLVREGKLARPQRSIRILLMPEMYGSLSYIASHPERMKHTLAAMTVDTPAASYRLAGTEYTFYMNPQVAMSYTDALIMRIARAYLGSSRPAFSSVHTPGTDSYLGEPSVGVPTVWSYSGTGVVTHHNTEDKPDTVDPHSLRDLTAILGSYLYFNANAGERDIRWLASITLDHVEHEMASAASIAVDGLLSGDSKAGSYGLDKVAYLSDRGEQAILSVLRVVSGDTEHAGASLAPILSEVGSFRELQLARLRQFGAVAAPRQAEPGAKNTVVRRKRIGTIPLDDLPEDQREGFPSGAWDIRVITALYWCDGKRNVDEVSHLTEMELGPSKFDYLGYFRFLERHGYVEFAK